MISNCRACGEALRAAVNFCPRCGAKISPDTDSGRLSEPSESGGEIPPPEPCAPGSAWGIGPPALGIMALIPSAILVSLLALAAPLPVATVVASTLLGLIQLALVWVLTARSWPPILSRYGLVRPRMQSWRVGLTCAAALGASLGFSQLYVLAATALGLGFLLPPQLPADLLLPGRLAILSGVALVVITPIAEEIFFRGFVLRGLMNRWGVAPALVISAAIFAGMHFQPGVVVPVFFTGLLLGALYWHTGSIWPGVLVHGAQNLIAVIGIVLGL